MLLPELPNAGQPLPRLVTSGRPTAEHMALAKERGVTQVINLCTLDEPSAFDPVSLMRELGLDYVHIPVAGAAGLTRENARALADALAAASGPSLLYCASSNRVGALLALKAAWIDGVGVDEALELGRRGGLKAAEPAVRQLLGA